MRYFLFSYRWAKDFSNGSGNLLLTSRGFPSQDDLKAHARQKSESDNIVITGWNEFNNEEDYIAFRGEP